MCEKRHPSDSLGLLEGVVHTFIIGSQGTQGGRSTCLSAGVKGICYYLLTSVFEAGFFLAMGLQVFATMSGLTTAYVVYVICTCTHRNVGVYMEVKATLLSFSFLLLEIKLRFSGFCAEPSHGPFCPELFFETCSYYVVLSRLELCSSELP